MWRSHVKIELKIKFKKILAISECFFEGSKALKSHLSE